MNLKKNESKHKVYTDLFCEILKKRKPGLETNVNDIRSLDFSKEDLEEIVEILVSEFVSTGLLESSEPNERGFLIEDLIDIVNKKLIY